MTQRPHPEALLDAAVRYANHGIPILPDQLVNRRPDPAAGPPLGACRRRDCPALPIHGPRRLDRDNDAWHTSHVGRWWTANPDAAIATVAGAAFDVIEIHSAIPPDAILEWLSHQGQPAGPALYVSLGRLQLLAAPDSYQADRYDSAAAAILYLAPSCSGLSSSFPSTSSSPTPTSTPSPPRSSSRTMRALGGEESATPSTAADTTRTITIRDKESSSLPLDGPAAAPRHRASGRPWTGSPDETTADSSSFLAVGSEVGRQAQGQRVIWPWAVDWPTDQGAPAHTRPSDGQTSSRSPTRPAPLPAPRPQHLRAFHSGRHD